MPRVYVRRVRAVQPDPSHRRSVPAFWVGPRAVKWSWRRDLNPRPSDYKSDALPTELRQPGTVLCHPQKHRSQCRRNCLALCFGGHCSIPAHHARAKCAASLNFSIASRPRPNPHTHISCVRPRPLHCFQLQTDRRRHPLHRERQTRRSNRHAGEDRSTRTYRFTLKQDMPGGEYGILPPQPRQRRHDLHLRYLGVALRPALQRSLRQRKTITDAKTHAVFAASGSGARARSGRGRLAAQARSS